MKKTNGKVGAEPRIRRKFNKSEGFHVGVHRNEWGLFDSRSNPYCFVNGYFFTYGKWFIRNHTTLEDIKKSWDDYYKGNIYNACFGIIDRKRKIAVIKNDNYYSYSLEYAVPNNYTILHVNEIRYFDITKNLHKLYTEHCKYLIYKFVNQYSDYYNVINNNRAKVIFKSKYLQDEIDDVKRRLDKISSEHNISRTKDLFAGKECFINVSKSWSSKYIKVKYPTINQIINDTIFTDEQKAYIEKCKFYSEYRKYGISNLTWLGGRLISLSGDLTSSPYTVKNEYIVWKDRATAIMVGDASKKAGSVPYITATMTDSSDPFVVPNEDCLFDPVLLNGMYFEGGKTYTIKVRGKATLTTTAVIPAE